MTHPTSQVARQVAKPNVVEVPPEVRAELAGLLNRVSVDEACRRAGVGRTALLGMVASGRCLPGSLALVREALRRAAEAQADSGRGVGA